MVNDVCVLGRLFLAVGFAPKFHVTNSLGPSSKRGGANGESLYDTPFCDRLVKAGSFTF
jgi:hypothetical protein